MAFELFIVQHSHIDIGYTERQERIADYQAQFIAQAVQFALSEKQARRSADTRFKFTCEGYWAIEQYLRKYGAGALEPLLRAIRSGALELSAFYVHLTELLDEGHLRDSLEYMAGFAREHQLPLNMGMANDINGFSWGMADALADVGVKYLITNLNSHHGGPPFVKPSRPFYWESPRGQKLLTWSGLAYHKANLLGLIPGYSPTSDPGIPGMEVEEEGGSIDIRDISFAEKRIFQLMAALKSQNYAYNFLPLMGSGLYTDNSPVNDAHCELIADWNAAHGAEVHIRTASLEEFFQHLEAHGGAIPTFRGDWNDWWTDGVISTPGEVKLFRNAQRTKRVVEMLDPRAEIVGREELAAIANKLILYAEHTWGHSASYYKPWHLLVQQLDARKAKLAIDADVLAAEALDRVLRAYGEGDFTSRRPFEYLVINPLAVSKKFVAYLPVDFWEVGEFQEGYAVKDEAGKSYPAQHTQTLRGWLVAVEVELGPGERRALFLRRGPASADPLDPAGTFINPWYRLEWDANGIRALTMAGSASSVLPVQGERLGEPLYQVFPGANRTAAAGFGYTRRRIPEGEVRHGVLESLRVAEHGPVFTVLEASYQVAGASHYKVYFTLYAGLAQIGVSVEMTKDIVVDPEGMYAAFPFNVAGGQWHLDKPGALVLPGRDQLPGTCCDYYTAASGAILAGPEGGVALSCLDAPLLTIGGLKLWKYSTTIDPSGTFYSWLTNNKWETNFRADCGGFYEFRYVIEASPRFANPQAGLESVKNNCFEALVVRK